MPAAAGARGPAPVPQTSPWALGLQVLAMVFLYNLYMSPKTPAAPPMPPAGSSALLERGAPLAPTPTPLAAGVADALGLGAAMRAAQDGLAGIKHVQADLQYLEDGRRANLALARGLGTPVGPLWPPFTPFEVLVYLSLSAAPLDVCAEAAEGDSGGGAPLPNATFMELLGEERKGSSEPHAPPLLWRQRHLTLEDTARSTREQHFNISLPPSALANASAVFAHVFFRQVGAPLLPGAPGFSSSRVHKAVVPLTKLLARKPRKPTFSLMDGGKQPTPTPMPRFGIGAPPEAGAAAALPEGSGEAGNGAAAEAAPAAAAAAAEAEGHGDGVVLRDAAPAAPPAPVLPLPYWKPTLHVQLVHDWSTFPSANAVPPNVATAIQLKAIPQGLGGGEGLGGGYGYLPHLYVNDFWLLGHHLVALNESLALSPVVPLAVSYSPASMWRWALQSQMQSQWDMQASMGLAGSSDTDMIKSILTDTNPWLLALTIVVSLLHSLFDVLAFRNDITFWRSARSMEGLSTRTVAMSVFFQGVIMLYLFDFGDTSWMVLASTVVGFCIECWKLMRALGGKVSWAGWRPTGVDWGTVEVSYAVSKTAEYDSIATGHLLVVMYPLVAGYAAYSLSYERHRGWYSWVLSSLTSFIYMFGFAQMVPQLYINFRLKSVASMPWKTMMYKSLNTVIDDLFSFIVKMPMMHRLACFRDDIIFVIYLYQRWVYRVDLTRRNEYGQLAEDELEAKRIKAGVSRPCRRGKYELRE